MSKPVISYKNHRFPRQVIARAVWLHLRFPPSLRLVEEMLLERGIVVSYETIRRWVRKFGPAYAKQLRRKTASRRDIWHLDEVVISVAGRKHWLWRAVDQDGYVLDEIVQNRRNAKAARRLLIRLLKKQGLTPKLLRSGRDFAAWIGLTPRDHSTAGKTRLGVITRAGDEALRSAMVLGATSLLRQVRACRGKYAAPWLVNLLKRKPPKLAAVALANKMARIAWKMMVTGENYRKPAVQPDLACAAGIAKLFELGCVVVRCAYFKPSFPQYNRSTGRRRRPLRGGMR